ncbi:uncharacterized protein ACOB8E_008651 [Sarcophilus harrisii]
MSREPSPRRRPSPAVPHKTPSQDQLIAELQGRLGIRPEEQGPEQAGAEPDAWLTEGVVITVRPRGRRDGGQVVEKVPTTTGVAQPGLMAARPPPSPPSLRKAAGPSPRGPEPLTAPAFPEVGPLPSCGAWAEGALLPPPPVPGVTPSLLGQPDQASGEGEGQGSCC